MRLLKMLPVAMTLATCLTGANAAADFVTIQRVQANLNDANPRLLVNFTLPETLNTSAAVANSAVMSLDARDVQFAFNEVYVNPPTLVCNSNTTDGNQPGSIGLLRGHEDQGLSHEWAVNQIAFSSRRLVPGANKLLVCIRSDDGDAGPTVGNLDNISVQSIVLHYHTSD